MAIGCLAAALGLAATVLLIPLSLAADKPRAPTALDKQADSGVWFGGGQYQGDGNLDPASSFEVKHFLLQNKGNHGVSTFTVTFEEQAGPANKDFARKLSSISSVRPDFKQQLGTAIAALNDVCDLNQLSIKIMLTPTVEMNDGTGHRQYIQRLSVFDCADPDGGPKSAAKIKPMPRECVHGGFDDNNLDLTDVVPLFQACHAQLQRYRGRQKAYDRDSCADVVNWLNDQDLTSDWDSVVGLRDEHRVSFDVLGKLLESQGGANCKPGIRILTPLIAAADTGRSGYVRTLLEHGARVNDPDKDGLTAFDHANDKCINLKDRSRLIGGPHSDDVEDSCAAAALIAQSGGVAGTRAIHKIDTPDKGEVSFTVNYVPENNPARRQVFSLQGKYDGAQLMFNGADMKNCQGDRFTNGLWDYQMLGLIALNENREAICRGESVPYYSDKYLGSEPVAMQWIVGLDRSFTNLLQEARDGAQLQDGDATFKTEVPIHFEYVGRDEDKGTGTAIVTVVVRP